MKQSKTRWQLYLTSGKQALKGILCNEYDNINEEMGNVDISDLLTSEIFALQPLPS